MTIHTIRAQPTVRFRVPGQDDMEGADPIIEIEFGYTPGYPAQGPSYYSGGEPAEGAELSYRSARVIEDDGIGEMLAKPLPAGHGTVLDEIAEDWLQDAGYDRACALAEDCSGPDPDEAYERMRDARADRFAEPAEDAL